MRRLLHAKRLLGWRLLHPNVTHQDHVRGVWVESPFESIPASFWWSVVTYTTVGYGDLVPLSVVGQFMGSLTMIIGVFVLAMPISVVSTNFGAVWREFQEERKMSSRLDDMEKEAVETALSMTNPAQQLKRIAFEIWDEDVIGDDDFMGE